MRESRNQGSRKEKLKEKRASEGSRATGKGLSEHAKKSRWWFPLLSCTWMREPGIKKN